MLFISAPSKVKTSIIENGKCRTSTVKTSIIAGKHTYTWHVA
jgi:hypothetical protein